MVYIYISKDKKTDKKINMNNSIFKVLCVLVFWANLGTVGDLVIDRYLTVLFSCLVLFILYNKTKLYYLSQFRTINLLIILYCLYNAINSVFSVDKNIDDIKTIALSTDINYTPASTFVGFAFALKILSLFFIIEYAVLNKSLRILIKIFLYLTIILLTTNDMLIFLKGINVNGGDYLLGNKFQVAYMHYFLLLFYTLKGIHFKSLNINKCYLTILYTALFSFYIKCTTAVLGSIILLLFYYNRKRIHKYFYNPKFIICVILLTASFFWIFTDVLNNNFVNYILVDILGKDPTLTGRVGIYALLDDTFLLDTIWGVGLENSHSFMAHLFGAANTQNGLFEVWVEQGLIGTILFLSLIYTITKSVETNIYRNYSFPTLSLMYVFILLGTVEITFGYRFCILLAFYIPTLYKKTYKINSICEKTYRNA